MAQGSKDLHGNAPDSCAVALLLIDVINDLEFPGNEEIVKEAPRMAERIAKLKKRARAADVPCVYVNDNFGKWRSDFEGTVEACLRSEGAGRFLAETLRPGPEDYCVLKPKHSGFYSTTLDLLLRHFGAKTLIITGIAGDRCVLFTANDAYLRDYKIFVPADCAISNRTEDNRQALKLMERVLEADVRESGKISFARLAKKK
jgi:nicotinamidase-related amidase